MLATRAFLFSIGVVTLAAGLGQRLLDDFAIPLLVLQIAAGLILFRSLQAVMQQYAASPPENVPARRPWRSPSRHLRFR